MKIDFREQFKEYSNIELLKILKRPDAYQAEAVEAAGKILSERKVSAEEADEVQMHFQELEDNATAKAARINAYKSKMEGFLEPVIYPNRNVAPVKWLNIFLAVLVIQYVYTLYESILQLIAYSKCVFCGYYMAIFPVLHILYVPFVFYLLYKKRRWGWIILFADSLFTLISRLSSSLIYYQYVQPDTGDSGLLLLLFFKAMLLFFLWKKEVANFFGVSEQVKRRTAIYILSGSIILISSIYLI